MNDISSFQCRPYVNDRGYIVPMTYEVDFKQTIAGIETQAQQIYHIEKIIRNK